MAEELDPISLTIEVVASYVCKNHMRPDDVAGFITSVHEAVSKLQAPEPALIPQEAAEPGYTPAVSVRKSLANPDFVISMIDGKPYKALKRHLGSHGLTPDEYRQRFGLKPDYPMVAPNYSAARQAAAKAFGLGRKVVRKVEEAVGIEPAAEAPRAKRGRKPRSGALAAS